MAIRDWLRPPRHLVALFLLLTLVPSLLLVVFGWRLLRQDFELERQQIQTSREQAADVIVGALEQIVSAVEGAMGDGARLEALAQADGAVAALFTRDDTRVFPQRRLLFHPVAEPGTEAPPAAFAAGELIEFRERDPVRAAAWFRSLARSAPESVRAGAEIRLARNLRKAGRVMEALDVYARLAAPASAVGGVPAELLARWARCGLLAEGGPSPQLREEGRRLAADLLGGRWRLDREQFTLHFADAARWAGSSAPALPAEAMALSTAVEQLYRQWRQTAPGVRFSGRRTEEIDEAVITRLWQGTGERGTALVAASGYVQAQWMPRLAPLLDRHGLRASLGDSATRAVPSAATRRAAGETGLPWTLRVDPVATAPPGRFSGRRGVWLAGLGILALLVSSGSYVVGRAVSRELAVARLQSDFVSAVSHEFRTPLTSLRQLSEMLGDRPDASLDRRRAYYAAIARQTDRLHRLVESLLDFGRMEAGTSPYRFAPLDGGALVADIVQQFAGDPASRGYDVRLERPASGVMISADRDALTNALWNLLDNAVKYSPESRMVWVDVAAGSEAMFVRVRDRGLGIPPVEQREIFGKFVRGATARAGNISGTGIGLAMVSHIVRAHGGSVSVESAPGSGSTFTMRLPVMHGAATPIREGAWLGS